MGERMSENYQFFKIPMVLQIEAEIQWIWMVNGPC